MSQPDPAERSAQINPRKLESDVTVYGATGFVGRHVCNYLFQAASLAYEKKERKGDDGPIRITLAGRNESKLKNALERVKVDTGLSSSLDSHKGLRVDIFVADSSDADAVRSMASRTRVVLNCAGPFSVYGTTVVEACAKTGADYLDITGEVSWAGEMRERYTEFSAKSGSRIISLCGFDSVPSDLAVFAAVQSLRSRRRGGEGKGDDVVTVRRAKTWHSAFGLANGGTIHTALGMPLDVSRMLFDENTGRLRPVPYFVDHPFHLASKEVKSSETYAAWRDRAAMSEWLNQLLSFDTELGGKFFRTLLGGGVVVSIPFFMAPVNAKVVNASAVALRYNKPTKDGGYFSYSERCLPTGFTASSALGIVSFIPAIVFQLSMLAMICVFKIPYIGNKLAMLLAPPGSGSPDSLNKMGYAEVYAEAHAKSPEKENRIDRGTCFLSFSGDPGNLVTAQCVGECALSLVLNREDLPPKSKDGFGTPAQLLGKVLLKRLTESPVRPVKVETGVILDHPESDWGALFRSVFGFGTATALAFWLGMR